MEEHASDGVQATETAIRIISSLHTLGGRAGVTDIANRVGCSKSAVHKHLTTLHSWDFVVKEGSEYRLGLRFLEMGGFIRSRMELYKVARPKLDAIADETGERINLLVEENGLGVYLCSVGGERAMSIDVHAGLRVGLHTTALGKAILAHLPEKDVEAIVGDRGLDAATENTITSREELYDTLETVRERGYAIDDEERVRGVRCVAVPLQGIDGEVLAAISLSAPKRRVTGEQFEVEIPELLLSAANEIELDFTYD